MNKNFYISSYSVDQKILNKLLGNDGNLAKLYVDSHGLRIQDFSDKTIANAYKPITDRVLHAKIILEEDASNSRKHLIHVMTGNLRKKTNEDLNLIVTLPIEDELCLQVKNKWFNSHISSNLFLWSDGKKVTKIETNESIRKVFFKSLKESINKIKNKKNLSFYGISPWGSKKFIDDVLDYFETDKVFLYCPKTYKWPYKHEEINEAYIYRKDNFPHLKFAFVTDGDDIIWAYIGSANFTEDGFGYSQNSNYEAVLFFEGKEAANKLKELKVCLHLKSPHNWWQKTEKETDYSGGDETEKEDFRVEDGDKTSFEEYEKIRFITQKLMEDEHQEKLNKIEVNQRYAFDENEVLILENDNFYKLKITKYENNSLDLENIEFPLPHIGYSEEEQVLNQNQINYRIDNIYKQVWRNTCLDDSDDEEDSSKDKKKKPGNSKPNSSLEEWNVRFPLPSQMSDLSSEEIQEIIKKCKKFLDKTEDENQKLFLTIWKDLLTAKISNEEN